MRLTELLGAHVRTESGERLGTVHEVRAELGERHATLIGIVLGVAGVRERLGLVGRRRRTRSRGRTFVPWSEILRVRRGEVVVRDTKHARSTRR